MRLQRRLQLWLEREGLTYTVAGDGDMHTTDRDLERRKKKIRMNLNEEKKGPFSWKREEQSMEY